MAQSSNPRERVGSNSGVIDNKAIRGVIERIEALQGEKAGIAEDIKEEFLKAKAGGYDVAIIREVLKRRKKSREDLAEWDSLVAAYEDSLPGVLA